MISPKSNNMRRNLYNYPQITKKKINISIYKLYLSLIYRDTFSKQNR